MREFDPQREWIAGGDALIRKGSNELGRVNELHALALARRGLQADEEIRDLQLVLDERPAGLAVLAAPFDVGECDAITLDKETRAAASFSSRSW
jgi:hypothetical protein